MEKLTVKEKSKKINFHIIHIGKVGEELSGDQRNPKSVCVQCFWVNK
jgi:hypothetical protein